jgi:hypothetical protein
MKWAVVLRQTACSYSPEHCYYASTVDTSPILVSYTTAIQRSPLISIAAVQLLDGSFVRYLQAGASHTELPSDSPVPMNQLDAFPSAIQEQLLPRGLR